MQVQPWSTTCCFWKGSVGPLGSLSSTVSIPFALLGQAEQMESCFKGIPRILPGRESPSVAARMDDAPLLTGACSGAWRTSKLGERRVGKLSAPERGWFNLSSCGSISFLESPVLCGTNFMLKQLLSIPSCLSNCILRQPEEARIAAGFAGRQKACEC